MLICRCCCQRYFSVAEVDGTFDGAVENGFLLEPQLTLLRWRCQRCFGVGGAVSNGIYIPIHVESWGTISLAHSPHAIHTIAPSQVVSAHHIGKDVAMVALVVVSESRHLCCRAAQHPQNVPLVGEEQPHDGLLMGIYF